MVLRQFCLLISLGLGCNESTPSPLASDAGPVVDAAVTDAPFACSLVAAPGVPFGAPVVLSDPLRVSLAPAIAARGEVAIVAWHQFPPAGGGSSPEVAWRAVARGCVGPVIVAPETLTLARWPSVAATASGFVIAYEAESGNDPTVVRLLELDGAGQPLGAPETVSAAGSLARLPRVAASGADVAIVWTDGARHWLSLRGPGETLTAMPIGGALQFGGIINFPRVAMAPDGTTLVAWDDGLSEGSANFEVFLAARPRHGSFAAPVNVSNTPDDDSADVALAMESDGTLDIAWAEQSPVDENVFEAAYTRRAPGGTIAAPALYGAQGTWVVAPSVVPGLAATWTTGMGTTGAPWYASGPAPAVAVWPGVGVFQQALARGDDGAPFLVIADGNHPARVQFGWSN